MFKISNEWDTSSRTEYEGIATNKPLEKEQKLLNFPAFFKKLLHVKKQEQCSKMKLGLGIEH